MTRIVWGSEEAERIVYLNRREIGMEHQLVEPDRPIPVPADVALCPECEEALYCEITEWECGRCIPTDAGVLVYCVHASEEPAHRCYHSDWVPVDCAVTAWAQAVLRVNA